MKRFLFSLLAAGMCASSGVAFAAPLPSLAELLLFPDHLVTPGMGTPNDDIRRFLESPEIPEPILMEFPRQNERCIPVSKSLDMGLTGSLDAEQDSALTGDGVLRERTTILEHSLRVSGTIKEVFLTNEFGEIIQTDRTFFRDSANGIQESRLSIHYTYNDLGQVTSESLDLGQDGSIDATRNFLRDASGDLIGMTRDSDGDGLPEQEDALIRDRDGRLARIQSIFPRERHPGSTTLVKRNDSGEIIEIAEDVNGDGEFDAVTLVERLEEFPTALTRVLKSGFATTTSFHYDNKGNRVLIAIDSGSNSTVDQVTRTGFDCEL